MARQLGITDDAPDLDERTAFWLGNFNLMNRARPALFGGIAPINPMDILAMAEKLDWPCSYDEAIHVLTAMDDAFREKNAPQSSGGSR